eukprot:11475959-Alexandrium_andersonii.AAC.1
MSNHRICKLGFERCDKVAASVLALACAVAWVLQESQEGVRFEIVSDNISATKAAQGMWASSMRSASVARVRALFMA